MPVKSRTPFSAMQSPTLLQVRQLEVIIHVKKKITVRILKFHVYGEYMEVFIHLRISTTQLLST